MNTTFEELETIAYQTYEQGNLKDAFEFFMTLATDHHDSNAMSQIAFMYSMGEGVRLDFDQSIYWDKQAIAFGCLSAIKNLAITYRMKGDILQAKQWFEKSIQAGDDSSALELAKLYMVSDKETAKIRQLLLRVLQSDDMLEDDIEQAEYFLTQY